jgi:hypothetical protein
MPQILLYGGFSAVCYFVQVLVVACPESFRVRRVVGTG